MPILTWPHGTSSSGGLNVRKVAETTTTVTLAWDEVPGAEMYIFTIDGSEFLTDGKRHFTFNPPNPPTVKIGKPRDGKSHSYGVKALGVTAQGAITTPKPATTDDYADAEYDNGTY